MSYDVIIPTHQNRTTKSQSLTNVLTAFRHATEQPGRLIIVNNGDTDLANQRWLQETLCPTYGAQYTEVDQASRAKARNVGAASVTSDFILFCDDDVIPHPKTIALTLERAAQGYFCCGARRRFLPMNLDRHMIGQLVNGSRWNELDALANDSRAPASGHTNGFKETQYHRTYIGCFGLVPTATFHEVGGFDERFEGWGLEDTELMRRLLGVLGFRSLRAGTVWHVDHMVSPYIWEEHWGKNLRLYCDRQLHNPMLQLSRLFIQDSCEASDPTVLVPPPSASPIEEKTSKLSLAPVHRRLLEDYVDRAAEDDNVAAIILSGSALRLKTPSDLDIERVLFIGDTACRKKGTRSVPLEEHIVRISTLQHTLHKPFFYPDTWPWIANRYVEGLYLHQKVDLQRVVANDIPDILYRTALHLLTFHFGRILQAAKQPHIADRLNALKDAAVIGCLSRNTFPDRMSYPYTGDQQVGELVQRVESAMQHDHFDHRKTQLMVALEKPLRLIIKDQKLTTRPGWIYYGASQVALETLAEIGISNIRADWGKITNDQQISEKVVELYGLMEQEQLSPTSANAKNSMVYSPSVSSHSSTSQPTTITTVQ